jgi:rubredoxin
VSVIDISCPACGRIDSVRKERLGSYRCTECGHEFDHEELDPVEQSKQADGR